MYHEKIILTEKLIFEIHVHLKTEELINWVLMPWFWHVNDFLKALGKLFYWTSVDAWCLKKGFIEELEPVFLHRRIFTFWLVIMKVVLGLDSFETSYRAKINCRLASVLASKHRIKDNPRWSLVSFSLSPTLLGVVSQELEMLIHHFETVVFRIKTHRFCWQLSS